MAKKKPLSLYIALDRSGSMSDRWNVTIDSLNEYVNGLKVAGVEGTVHITAFDSTGATVNLISLADGVSIQDFTPLQPSVISPGGMTPLFDAAAYVMNRALDCGSKRTIVVILTDGHENASKEYTQAAIKAKVEAIQAKKWEVVFLGANFDVSTYTKASGLEATKFRNVDFRNLTARATMTADLTSNSIAYAVMGSAIDMSLNQ